MMLVVFGLLLAVCQNSDHPSLIRQLGDPVPAAREKALKALAMLGDAVVPDLHRALGSEDLEIRIRAGSLLFQREEHRWLDALRDAQRPMALGMVVASVTPGAVLAETDGVRFTLKREEWSAGGAVLGTRFHTAVDPAPGVEVSWTIATVRDGTNLPMETCGIHSPGI